MSPYLVGCCLALVACKPHLCLPLLLVAGLWIWQGRHWRVVTGGIVTVGVSMGVAMWLDPGIVGHYLVGTAPPFQSDSLTAAAGAYGAIWLRLDPTVVPAAGVALGACATVCLWIRHRDGWRWAERLPGLLVLGLLSAPFCWWTDWCLALPAAMAVAVRVFSQKAVDSRRPIRIEALQRV